MDKDPQHKRSKITIFIMILGAIALLGSFIYFSWPFLSQLNNQEQVKKMIIEAGAWGPLVFILMQVAQILIAPIPGQVVALIGGYLFGPLLGIIYTMIGATIGFTLIFVLARKFGRPFVERFVSPKVINKFDNLTKDSKGVMVFFLIFLLPAFPDDIISFIAGLSTIKIRTLILISLAGRLPAYIVLGLTGNGLAYDLKIVIIIFVILAMLFFIAWRKRVLLREFVEHKNRISYLKEQWHHSWISLVLVILGMVILVILLYRLVITMPLSK